MKHIKHVTKSRIPAPAAPVPTKTKKPVMYSDRRLKRRLAALGSALSKLLQSHESGIEGFEALTVEALRELKKENDRLRNEIAKLRSLVDEIREGAHSALVEA